MKLYLLLSLMLFSFWLQAQTTTFNKRILLGCNNNTVFTGMEVTDSCYYLTGIVRDVMSCEVTGLFAYTDTLGNVSFSSNLPTDNGRYGMWEPSLHFDVDKNLIVSTYYIDSLGIKIGVVKYNTNGNLLWESLHENPFMAGTFIRADDMHQTQDSGYVLVNTIENTQGIGEVQVLKLDKLGNEEWQVIKGIPNFIDHNPCIRLEDNNTYTIGYMQHNIPAVNQNYTVRCILENLDSVGNTIWSWQSPSNMQLTGAHDFVRTKDRGYVVATAIGTEVPTGSSSTAFLQNGYVFKLDSARNFLWSKFLGGYAPNNNGTVARVLELEDSTIMTFGTKVDSYRVAGNLEYQYKAYVVQLSPQGDSLWSHEYHYLLEERIVHEIFDVERTPDDGFLICGQVRSAITMPSQQGWLLKLDKNGCLLPGCRLTTGILPTNVTDIPVKMTLYPNPTTEYLNIHYQSPTFKGNNELVLSILDIQGRIISNYRTVDSNNKTYVIPVYNLPSNTYMLTIQQNGITIASEQFIKG